jgi:hypothetical protein
VGICPSYTKGSSPSKSKNFRNFARDSRSTKQVQSVRAEIRELNSHSTIHKNTSNHFRTHVASCLSSVLSFISVDIDNMYFYYSIPTGIREGNRGQAPLPISVPSGEAARVFRTRAVEERCK